MHLPIGSDVHRKGNQTRLVGNSANGDMIAFTRINGTTTQAVTEHGGTFVVSGDAKTLTITSTGTNVFGQAIHNVSVYERQECGRPVVRNDVLIC